MFSMVSKISDSGLLNYLNFWTSTKKNVIYNKATVEWMYAFYLLTLDALQNVWVCKESNREITEEKSF